MKIDKIIPGEYILDISRHTLEGPIDEIDSLSSSVDLSGLIKNWKPLEQIYENGTYYVFIGYDIVNNDYTIVSNTFEKGHKTTRLSELTKDPVEEIKQNKSSLFGNTDSIMNSVVYKTAAEETSNVFKSFLEHGFTREEAFMLTMKMVEIATKIPRK